MTNITPNTQSDMHSNASAEDVGEWEFISSEDLVTVLEELKLKKDSELDDGGAVVGGAGGAGNIILNVNLSSPGMGGTDSHSMAPTPLSSNISSNSTIRPGPVMEDAIFFVNQVRKKFSDQPEVYREFLKILQEYKSETIDIPDVETRINHLFKEHPELIAGFYTFSSGYNEHECTDERLANKMSSMDPQALVPSSQGQSYTQQAAAIRHMIAQAPTPLISNRSSNSTIRPEPVMEYAIFLVNQVRNKFSDQPQVYREFLQILQEFKSETIDIPDVATRINHLFKEHPELIAGFYTFLPGYNEQECTDERLANKMSSYQCILL